MESVPQDRVVLRGKGVIHTTGPSIPDRRVTFDAQDILVYSNGLILYRVGGTWRTGRVPRTEAIVGDVEYVEAMMYDEEPPAAQCEKCQGNPSILPAGRCPACGAR